MNYVVVTQRPRMHHGITGRRRRRRGAAENQLLQAVEAVDQSVLVGHQLEVALVEAEYQLVLLKLVTCHQTEPQRSLSEEFMFWLEKKINTIVNIFLRTNKKSIFNIS